MLSVEKRKSIKEKWLSALRFGNYKQGRGYLRIEDNFCCLGVLCDVVNPDGWKNTNKVDLGDYQAFEHYGSLKYLPQNIQRDFGLPGYDHKNLAILNDKGKSFNEIADIIEKEWVIE